MPESGEPEPVKGQEMNKTRDLPYEIRWATSKDWPEIMDMVWRTFMKFEAGDYTEEGIANFRDFITNGRIYRMFLEGNYLMLVAMTMTG